MTRTFTPDEIAVLIAKLEALNGPNFAVENEICETLGLAPEGFEQNAQGGWTQYVAARDDVQIWRCPAYTYSLDAAARLIPDGHDWALHADNGAAIAGCMPASEDGCYYSDSHGATPAIALCIAALKARASIREQSSENTSYPQREPSSGEQQRDTSGVTAGETAPNSQIRESGTRPTGKPGATRPPAHEASGPGGRDSIEGGLS